MWNLWYSFGQWCIATLILTCYGVHLVVWSEWHLIKFDVGYGRDFALLYLTAFCLMKELEDIHKWKHDQCSNTWSSLYADATPEQSTLSPIPHYWTDCQLSVVNQTFFCYTHKSLWNKKEVAVTFFTYIQNCVRQCKVVNLLRYTQERLPHTGLQIKPDPIMLSFKRHISPCWKI